MNTSSSAIRFTRVAFYICVMIFAFAFLANAAFVPIAENLDDYDVVTSMFIEQLNFDEEGNFVSWFGSALLLVAALGCFVLSVKQAETNKWIKRLFFVMGVGFVVLSADDAAEFHNQVENVLTGTAFIDEEMDAEDLSLAVLALNDVAQIHSLANNALSEDELDDEAKAAEALDDAVGPLFAALLAVTFGVIFLLPLSRVSKADNTKFLFGTLACVILVVMSEQIYQKSGCEEDWCFQLSSLFEESFEIVAILLFIAFLMREIYGTSAGAFD